LTPAAVGQRIRQLEEQMGTPLFQRTTRRVDLTEAGLRLVPEARSALAALGACARAARGDTGPAPHDVVIGTRHELGMSWILPFLPHLRRRHPHVTFHVYFGSGSDILLRVRSGEIDCGVGSMRVDDPKLDSVALHREDYALVGAPRLLAKRPLRRASDARDHTLIEERPALPLYAYWRDAVAVHERLSFKTIVYFGTIAAIRAAALAGEGVAVLPAYLVARDLERHRLLRLLPRVTPLHDYFRLIFRADDPRRSVLQALAESMREVPIR
jgi:DNA-binding transcriptional LysR family regulator